MGLKRITKHYGNLQTFAKSSAGVRKQILNNCSCDFINCICECVLNVAEGNAPVSTVCLEKLKPYKRTLNQLLDKRTSVAKKRKLLNQDGGFLPILLPAVIEIIGGLLNSSINGSA